MQILLDALFTFFRGFGFFAVIFSYLVGFFLSYNDFIKLGNFLFIDVVFNIFLKNFFKVLMGDKAYPIIGKGTRPPGAVSCGFFIPTQKIEQVSESYGMPSGHSQTFAFVATLISLHLKKSKSKHMYKYILLILLTIVAMLARIYIEKCHTIQQTLIGATIGLLLATFLVKYYGNPFSK